MKKDNDKIKKVGPSVERLWSELSKSRVTYTSTQMIGDTAFVSRLCHNSLCINKQTGY